MLLSSINIETCSGKMLAKSKQLIVLINCSEV